jgi:hypothetical protein
LRWRKVEIELELEIEVFPFGSLKFVDWPQAKTGKSPDHLQSGTPFQLQLSNYQIRKRRRYCKVVDSAVCRWKISTLYPTPLENFNSISNPAEDTRQESVSFLASVLEQSCLRFRLLEYPVSTKLNFSSAPLVLTRVTGFSFTPVLHTHCLY